MRRVLSSLRFRLLLLVLLAIIPALVLVLYTASEQRRQVMLRSEENASRIATSAAVRHEQLVKEIRTLMVTIAQFPAVRARDSSSCNDLLSVFQDWVQRGMTLGVADRDGFVVCTIPDRSDLRVSGPGASIFGLAVQTKDFAVGEYFLSSMTAKPKIGFGYPVIDQSGDVQTVVFSSVLLASLNELASTYPMPTGSSQMVTDRNGTILVHYPDPDKWIGQNIAESRIFQAVQTQKGQGMVETVGVDDVARLYAFTPLNGLLGSDLVISIGIPSDMAYAEVNAVLGRNLSALGIVAVLALAAAWFGSDVFLLQQLNALLSASKRIEAGDLRARTGLSYGIGELGQLAHAFDSMARSLEERDAKLQQEERRRVGLLHQVITAQEEERLRIAREMHDETGQSLTMLMVGLDNAASQLPPDAAKATATLRTIRSIADGMLDDIHRLVQDLRPSLLDLLGLESAIKSFGEERLGSIGVRLFVEKDGLEGRLPIHIETVLFRVAQEAFTNIIRHAHASKVTVRLARENECIVFQISDDGQGFDADSATQDGRYGLRGMRERASILQGEFHLKTAPGNGTVIEVIAPLTDDEKGTDGHNSRPDR